MYHYNSSVFNPIHHRHSVQPFKEGLSRCLGREVNDHSSCSLLQIVSLSSWVDPQTATVIKVGDDKDLTVFNSSICGKKGFNT